MALPPIKAFLACLALSLLSHVFPAPARAGDMVSIGVLAFRDKEQTLRQWAPTAGYLSGKIRGKTFQIIPLYFPELDKAVADKSLDFVFTNPEHYLNLSIRHRLAAMLTLMPLAEGVPVIRFGGVILARSDRTDIRNLEDVRGKTIAAVGAQSLGGYLAQSYTLYQAGVHTPFDTKPVKYTGMPHDKVVQAVLQGDADVGFVRTGVIEAMVREGKLDGKEVKLINPFPLEDFPQQRSTELYPEWPFAAMPHVQDALVKQVARALLAMDATDAAAKAGGYHGFAPPGDYRVIDDIRLKLRAHPDQLEYFGIAEIYKKYSTGLLVFLALLLVSALAFLALLARKNRQLGSALDRAEKLALRDVLLDSLGEGVYGINPDGRCTFINPAALNMLGMSREEVLGKHQHELFHHHRPDGSLYPAEECPIHLTVADGVRRESDEMFFRKDGSRFLVRMLATPTWDHGRVSGAVVAFQDITERKELEDQIRDMALHDALTGLPNRRLLEAHLSQASAKARRSGNHAALLFLDLDGFKPINDTYGHEAGDVVLVEVARRLLKGVRATDTVSRLAGDEFVLIIEDVKLLEDVSSVAEKLIDKLALPIRIGAKTCMVTASVGIALFPDHGENLDSLLHHADRAMYQAKNAGKNTWCHTVMA